MKVVNEYKFAKQVFAYQHARLDHAAQRFHLFDICLAVKSWEFRAARIGSHIIRPRSNYLKGLTCTQTHTHALE